MKAVSASTGLAKSTFLCDKLRVIVKTRQGSRREETEQPCSWSQLKVYFRTFYSGISYQIKSDVLAKIKASPSLALMIDENTDITILKQLIVYCRILDGGKLASHFLTVRELSDGTVNTISLSKRFPW